MLNAAAKTGARPQKADAMTAPPSADVPSADASSAEAPRADARPVHAPCARAPGRLTSRACALAAVAAAAYALLLTRGDLDPFGAEPAGLTFNSMLSHMLRGRWDVDPAAIGVEAFVRDGRSYAYFGPLPALLRLPLLPVPGWRTLHVERLSCWLAILLGAAAQSGAVLLALSRAGAATRRALAPPLLLCCALGGPPTLLAWRGALIYHESILWAWALAMGFVMLAMRSLLRGASAGTLTAAAGCAGLCLLTRSTTGAGLLASLGLLVLRALAADAPGSATPRPGGPAPGTIPSVPSRRPGAGPAWHRLCRREVWLPSLVAAASVAAALAVNQARWGNPLQFADLHAQLALVAAHPDRLARLDRYGLFNLRRVWFGALYYIAPFWSGWAEAAVPLDGRIARLFDALERPASSIVLTDPLWCVLAWRGATLMRAGRALPGAGALAAGLCLAPGLMLAAWYMAFRYRVEFTPLLLALSCAGLAAWAPRLDLAEAGRARLGLFCLCLAQLVSTAAIGYGYRFAPLGPSPGHAGISLLAP